MEKHLHVCFCFGHLHGLSASHGIDTQTEVSCVYERKERKLQGDIDLCSEKSGILVGKHRLCCLARDFSQAFRCHLSALFQPRAFVKFFSGDFVFGDGLFANYDLVGCRLAACFVFVV